MLQAILKFFYAFRFTSKLKKKDEDTKQEQQTQEQEDSPKRDEVIEQQQEEAITENIEEALNEKSERPILETERKQIVADKDVLPDPESLQWGPLPEQTPELSPVETLDENYLPPSFFRYAKDQSHRFDNAPLEYVAIGLVVALASMLGNTVRIYPKRYDKTWSEPVNLWAGIIGSPSRKKTPSLKAGIAPLKHLKSKKEGSFDFVINDATYEAACIVAEENPSGILLFRDEISAWLTMLEKPDRAQERAFYLEGFSTGQYEQIRVTRDNVKIDNLTVSLLGGLQPSKLLKMLRSRNDGTNNDGLFERFQLLVFPDHASCYVDKKPDEEATETVNLIFTLLSDIGVPESPLTFSFTEDAQKLWDSWATDFKRKEVKLDEEQQTVWGKYPALCAKLSLIFELVQQAESFEGCGNFKVLNEVTLQSLRMAIKWIKFLWSHNRRIYNYGHEHGQDDKTKLLLKRLRQIRHEPFTGRDVYHGGPRGLRYASEFEKAADELVRLGCLKRVERTTTNHKKKFWYYKHPELLTKWVV
ncbi:DUF3987 domain-containing protein [Aliiglaciecola sp. 2_MG-2023]|uniref:DUF3987 domain-containing protein n=1 Tax=unclassified Aliiglaciecola TaxID=2593648 RepID=UPI0026E25002|nr:MULTISPECIES: DUF3987 domain-containing protein [unclassified Aliiglaciecola]MDO6710336.1 DUF3987 domain-containing protein [Aliiglaciecola sp. 2_MG-2023]MDO6751483.1 DUF3987 domain-containing protein [Aliiglaciecola sp. 1_MG-2023]